MTHFAVQQKLKMTLQINYTSIFFFFSIFKRAPVCPNKAPGRLNNRNLFRHCMEAGGQDRRVGRLVPSESWEGAVCSRPLSQRLAASAVFCLWMSSPRVFSPLPFVHACLWAHISPFSEVTRHHQGRLMSSSQLDHHRITDFQIRAHPQVLGAGTQLKHDKC